MIKEPYQDLRIRTKKFALAIISLYGTLPNTTVAQVLGKQVLRSGTSAGSQYRESQRAKSDADLISKMEGALQELDETVYWLELLLESGIVNQKTIQPLVKEADELIAIFVTIVKTLKSRKK